MASKHPITDRGNAEASPEARPSTRRPRRVRNDPKLYINFLPEGKGGRREDKGSVPLEVDVEGHIEERSDCEPGLYRIEKKRSGEFSGDVLFYSKEEDPEGSRLASTDEADDGVRSVDFVASPGEPADVARIIASTVSAALEAHDRRQRAHQDQPGAIDILRELEEIAERRVEREGRRREEVRAEISAMWAKENPTSREPELDDKTRLELAAVRETRIIPEIFRNMREMMSTGARIEEPQSWTDKILDFAKEFVPYIGPVAGPIIGQRLIGLLGKVDDATLMQAAGVQPTQVASLPHQAEEHQRPAITNTPTPAAAINSTQSEVGDESVTFESVLEGLIADLQEGNEPDDAIDDIAKLTTLQPPFLPVVAKMLGQSNSKLVQMLSDAKGVDLTPLVNTDEYINALRAGLKKRIRLPEVPSSVEEPGHDGVASRNGHKRGQTAVAQRG